MSVKQGDYLRRLRAENGLSQEKLAEKLGVSRQSVSKWEQGYAVPDTDNMMKLSKLYGVSVDDILNCAQPPQKQTVQEQPEKEQPPREDAKAPAAFKPAEPAFAAKKKKRSWLFYAYPFFALIAMLLLGIIDSSLWKSSWLCLLTIPVFYTAVISREKKDMRIFCYPALVLIAFFAGGFHLSLWHPLWLLFITIPIYYICAFVTHKNKKR